MKSLDYISRKQQEYHQYNDYIFKQTVQKRANGVLKLLGIPYTINNIILSEITDLGPKIHRLDFAGETIKNGEDICFVLECQSQLPTDDDILRFFQYVSSLLVLKKQKVELYILCMQKAPYNEKEFVLNDDCTYTMHVISLKDIRAEDIFKRIEDKNYNHISDEDIAALQLIAYTDYDETTLEILKRAHKTVEQLNITDQNEKQAIFYILNILSVNMLDENDYTEFMEETEMILDPRERYMKKKMQEEYEEKLKEEKQRLKELKQAHNKKLKEEKQAHNKKLKEEKQAHNKKLKEIAKKLKEEKIPIETITKTTGLTEKEIQNP